MKDSIRHASRMAKDLSRLPYAGIDLKFHLVYSSRTIWAGGVLGEGITNEVDMCLEVLRGRVLLRLQSISLCLMGVSADDMSFRRYVLLF